MSTAVPPPTFGATGFIPPSDQAILTGVQADINAAFAANLNFGSYTPQAQLAVSLTAIIGEVDGTFVNVTNLVDPAYSYGRFQDALGRIYNIVRIPPVATLLQVQCNGLPGTNIPITATIQDNIGNIYTASAAGKIGVGGNVILPFAANVPGPLAVPNGTAASIYQTVSGWDSIVVLSGSVGSAAEGRYAFEIRRQATLAANANNTNQAINGALRKVSGVSDSYVTDNPTNSPVTIGGVSVAANSLYIAVSGGADADVAQAIWLKKPPGTPMVGTSSAVVQDTSPGYTAPFPSYTIKWTRPAPIEIVFAINIVNSPAVPNNAAALIQNAILTAFQGNDGGPAATIGSTLYAQRYSAAVTNLGPWAQMRTITIGSANSPSAVFTGSLSGTTLTVSAITSGVIAIGDYLAVTGTVGGTGPIAAGTTVISQISGPVGGTGSYTVSTPQAVLSEVMAAFGATSNVVTTQINQEPELNPPVDVVVTVT